MELDASLQLLPLEIRLTIYDLLFTNRYVVIEPMYPDEVGEAARPLMKAVPMSAQILRVCKQFYEEGHVLLYGTNRFDCAQREGVKLLLQNIGPRKFALVKHVIVDWDQLQEISWSLAKPTYQQATSGLRNIELASWRTRTLRGKSALWTSVKTYESQLCQSAIDICQKHPNLRVVAQRAQHKTGRLLAKAMDSRVKWRFVTSIEEVRDRETVVDLSVELEILLNTVDNAA